MISNSKRDLIWHGKNYVYILYNSISTKIVFKSDSLLTVYGDFNERFQNIWIYSCAVVIKTI